MPISLNSILLDSGFSLSDVRLLRHKDNSSSKGKTPYELWRDNRPQFDLYQSTQAIKNEKKLNAPFWASFVGTPAHEILFVGIYSVSNKRVLDSDQQKPHSDGIDEAGTCHRYDLLLDDRLSDLTGRLIIDWGNGERAWIQRADLQNKTVLELRKSYQDQKFPGFRQFMSPLSKLDSLPQPWISILQISRGVYLLTCPKTKEHYVGSATGSEAFWQRWKQYALTGHGGNVALKSRDLSDYQVTILEVASSAASTADVLEMERCWMEKLQSREMGFNRNP